MATPTPFIWSFGRGLRKGVEKDWMHDWVGPDDNSSIGSFVESFCDDDWAEQIKVKEGKDDNFLENESTRSFGESFCDDDSDASSQCSETSYESGMEPDEESSVPGLSEIVTTIDLHQELSRQRESVVMHKDSLPEKKLSISQVPSAADLEAELQKQEQEAIALLDSLEIELPQEVASECEKELQQRCSVAAIIEQVSSECTVVSTQEANLPEEKPSSRSSSRLEGRIAAMFQELSSMERRISATSVDDNQTGMPMPPFDLMENLRQESYDSQCDSEVFDDEFPSMHCNQTDSKFEALMPNFDIDWETWRSGDTVIDDMFADFEEEVMASVTRAMGNAQDSSSVREAVLPHKDTLNNEIQPVEHLNTALADAYQDSSSVCEAVLPHKDTLNNEIQPVEHLSTALADALRELQAAKETNESLKRDYQELLIEHRILQDEHDMRGVRNKILKKVHCCCDSLRVRAMEAYDSLNSKQQTLMNKRIDLSKEYEALKHRTNQESLRGLQTTNENLLEVLAQQIY